MKERDITMTKELECLVTDIAQEATISELNQIISALKFQLEQKQAKEIEKAKQTFINAYKEFRKFAPYEEHYVDIYDDFGEFLIQEELFGVMDEEFLRGE